MAAQCFTTFQGLAMRLTRLNSCGVPVSGLNNSLASDGFVNVEMSAEVEDGTDYQQKNARGAYCVNERGCPLLRWWSLSIQFCQIDPQAFELLGHRVLDDYLGDSVGFAVDEEVACRTNFALEIWTKISGAGACSATGQQYIYWLFPWVVDAIMGDFTIEDAVGNMTMNARTKGGSGWQCGPYDVAWTAPNTPGPLPAPGVLAKDHLLVRKTEVAPPTIGCGYSPLSVPPTIACAA